MMGPPPAPPRAGLPERPPRPAERTDVDAIRARAAESRQRARREIAALADVFESFSPARARERDA